MDLKSPFFNYLYHLRVALGDIDLPNFIVFSFFFLVLARCIFCILFVYPGCAFVLFNNISITY
jgi:hypothetical protein